MQTKSKLDVWAERNPRLFLRLILGAFSVVSIAFLPAFFPDGCHSWLSVLTCTNWPSVHFQQALSGLAFLLIIVCTPEAFRLLRRH